MLLQDDGCGVQAQHGVTSALVDSGAGIVYGTLTVLFLAHLPLASRDKSLRLWLCLGLGCQKITVMMVLKQNGRAVRMRQLWN
jgi:hypothetical protein